MMTVIPVLLCSVLVYFEFRYRSPFIMLPVLLMGLVWFPLSFDADLVLRNGTWPVAESKLLFNIFFINYAFFRVLYLASRSPARSPWIGGAIEADRAACANLFTLSVLFSCLSLALFVVGLQIFSFSRALTLGWWEFVQSGSKMVLAGTYLSYASSALSIATLLIFPRSHSKGLFGIFLLAFYVIFCMFVLKTRSYVMIALAPMVLHLALNGRIINKIFVLVFALLAAFLFVAARAIRHAGSIEDFLRSDASELFSSAAEGGELNFVDAFVFFVSRQNHFPGFEEGATLLRIVFFWIPSSIADIKPDEFSYIMHNAYFGSSPGSALSMHPTLVGDAYGNHGLFGMVLYPIVINGAFMLVERYVALVSVPMRVVTFSLAVVTLLILARGAVYNSFMFFLLPLVAFTAALAVLKWLQRLLKN